MLVCRELPLCYGCVVPMVWMHVTHYSASSGGHVVRFQSFAPIHDALVYILTHVCEGICERNS